MKLYYLPGTSSLFPHIVLFESGLSFAAVSANGRTKTLEDGGDYRAVNPLGYVPSLQVEDGSVLTETVAIAQYVADRVPAMKLAPPNGDVRPGKNAIMAELHLLGDAFGLLLSAFRW